MSNNPYTSPVAPFWPLGEFTVNAGHPVLLSTNVGTQTQGSAFSLQMSRKIRGLIISFKAQVNTGNIYVMKSGWAKAGDTAKHPYTDTNCIIAIIAIGALSPLQIPCSGAFTTAGFTVDDIAIDGDHSADKVNVTAIYGS